MRDDEFDALLQETIKENGEELTIHFSNKLIESMTQDEIADITEHMKSTCPDNLSGADASPISDLAIRILTKYGASVLWQIQSGCCDAESGGCSVFL